MPQPTKADLEETISGLDELIGEALDPELSREELVGKVKEMSDLIGGAEDNEEDDEEE